MWWQYLVIFGFAWIISWCSGLLLRKIALKFGITDKPDNQLKTHRFPTPYLGGVAIWLGFTSVLLVVRLLTHFPSGTLHNLRGIIIGGSLIMLLGLLDDLKTFSYRIKFFWQLVIAGIAVFYDLRIMFIQPAYLGVIFTFIWIIGIINAFNIIDIMDGLASGVTFFACLAFLLIALPTEQIYVNFGAAALAGAVLGFWLHNYPPARMFMGDAGSLFLGFNLAVLAIGESYTHTNALALYAPILILGIPIFDTIFVMWQRTSQGKSPFLGSKDHFPLRLQSAGWSKKKILSWIYLTSLSLAICAFVVTQVKPKVSLGIYTIVGVLAIILAWKLSKIKPESPISHKTFSQTRQSA